MRSLSTIMEKSKNLKIERLKRRAFFGNTRRILKNPVSFLGDLVVQYGPVLRVTIATKKYLVLQDPDIIKYVLQDNHRTYDKLGITKILRLFFGEGLVTSNGELWVKKRRLIQPIFHKGRLSHILDIINEETSHFIESLGQKRSESQLNITREMLALNMAIVNRALFSNDDKEELRSMMIVLEDLTNYATRWMRSLIKVPISWPTPANIRFRKNCEKYDKMIYEMIERRRTYKRNDHLPSHDDLLDILLDYTDEDTNDEMNDKQLRDEITTMFMAGHDTTAHTLSWICFELAKNKGFSKKMNRESIEVLKNELPKLDDLPRLGFTNKVIKEGLRHYPSISAIQRRPLKDDFYKGIKFKASSHLLINIYGMHHHPDYWINPEEFNPGRFNSKSDQHRHPFVYIPFGGGPRRCIGSSFAMMVMVVVLSRLYEKFEFDVPKGYIPEIVPNITIKTKEGIPLILRRL